MLTLTVLAALSAAVWVYLLLAHGRFWAADQRLPVTSGDAEPTGGWPAVAVVVPARDEATMLPLSLTSLLEQDYPGELCVFLVDDASSDGTAEVAAKIADEVSAQRGGGRELVVVRSDGPPVGWAGKVAAMDRGVREIAEREADRVSDRHESAPTYVLFTDADIAHSADSVRRLVGFAEDRRLDLVSLMALLRTETAAERAIVPAFVYSFAQLYPFPRVNRSGSRTSAAAGGCMLVRRKTLAAAGGLAQIAGARIDDVALGRLIKQSRGEADGRIWLGLTTSVRSVRPYPRLADLWNMIARSAYTQLRFSLLLLAGTLLGLLVMYAVPPVLGVAFLAIALGGAGTLAAVIAGLGLGAWALMCGSYLPTLRLYGLSGWRAVALPAVMMLYGAMTFDSARRHHRGKGGMWKGRVSEAA